MRESVCGEYAQCEAAKEKGKRSVETDRTD